MFDTVIDVFTFTKLNCCGYSLNVIKCIFTTTVRMCFIRVFSCLC
jgi:hypothetical protein